MYKRGQKILAWAMLLMLAAPLALFADSEKTQAEVKRMLPRLVDEASLLTESEAARLLGQLDEISERQQADVVIVTLESLEGLGATQYADDIYDGYGFGFGPEHDGILLLLAMEEREWAISTTGFGIRAFTDAGQKYMSDHFAKYLSKGDFNKAFAEFATMSDDFISQAKSGAPYDIGNLPKKDLSPMWILYSALGGSGLAFATTAGMKSNLKSTGRQRVAANYLVADSMGLVDHKDQYLYQVITRSEIPKEEEGGSTVHTSSSGKTHGGSSGKF